MVVLHVDTSSEWRGGQVQLCHLVRGMVQRGVETAVACPEDAPLWRALAGIGARRVALPEGRTLRGALKMAMADADVVAFLSVH